MLHNEADGIASLAATEAMTHATCRRNIERRGLLVVERTQSLVVGPTASQRDKLRNYLNNVGCILNSFYCSVVYHLSLTLTILPAS